MCLILSPWQQLTVGFSNYTLTPKSHHPAQTQPKKPNTHFSTTHTVNEAKLQLMWGS